jgi:hypothetical protein
VERRRQRQMCIRDRKIEPKVENTPIPLEIEAVTKECYEYIQGKDTIQANLLVQSKAVTGDLIYKIFEKDKNVGTIIGTISGDTLIANYTFISEGQKSEREVAFLRKNKSLIEGYGESEMKENKMIFKEKQKLNFTGNIVLNEIPCK